MKTLNIGSANKLEDQRHSHLTEGIGKLRNIKIKLADPLIRRGYLPMRFGHERCCGLYVFPNN